LTVKKAGSIFNPISIDPKVEWRQTSAMRFVGGGVSNFQQAPADGDTLNQKGLMFCAEHWRRILRENTSTDHAFNQSSQSIQSLFTHIVFFLKDRFEPKDEKKW